MGVRNGGRWWNGKTVRCIAKAVFLLPRVDQFVGCADMQSLIAEHDVISWKLRCRPQPAELSPRTASMFTGRSNR